MLSVVRAVSHSCDVFHKLLANCPDLYSLYEKAWTISNLYFKLFRQHQHLGFLPAQGWGPSISTVNIVDLFWATYFCFWRGVLPGQSRTQTEVVPPSATIHQCATVLAILAPYAPSIIVSVPGQRWGYICTSLCFGSYLVLNFIPLWFAMESPRVERESLNPATVST